MESSTSLLHTTAKFEGHRTISSPIEPSKLDRLDYLKVHAFYMHGHERRQVGQARGLRWRRWALRDP